MWVWLAVVVQMRYGRFPAFVLIGWGGSMLVCVVFVVTPLLRTAPRDLSASIRENPVTA